MRRTQASARIKPPSKPVKKTDKKYWKVVKGKITESRLEYRDKKRFLRRPIRLYRAHFAYKYFAYDKEYSHSSLLQTWTSRKEDAAKHVKKYPINSDVVVRFDPDDPEHSLMEISTN